ncbi:murein L,D-transpeptidase catalytic domain family protein [Myroides sp. LJL119]
MKKGIMGFAVLALILTSISIKASYEHNKVDWTPELEKELLKESSKTLSSNKESYKPEDVALEMYNSLQVNDFQTPDQHVFQIAVKGYLNLKEKGIIKNNKLTILDFSVSSTKQRLWVIDMDNMEIVLQSYVAHGQKTGEEFANVFSNRVNSHMSSLGFYKTAEVYHGINGLSMRLDGLEQGINDNARSRAIVVHGAKYASKKLIDLQGRLGRSYGCPAVPVEVNKQLIDLIKNDSCLFIYHTDSSYHAHSKYV